MKFGIEIQLLGRCYADPRGEDQKEIVELLIGGGADVNAKEKYGRTPLDWALGETADIIRKHGGKTAEELK